MLKQKKELFINSFWKKANISGINDCWNWSGSINVHNYVIIRIPKMSNMPHRKQARAHRIAYELFYNIRIPENICVCHICDNSLCVNPYHLFLGTQLENIKDCVKKERHNKPLKHVGMPHHPSINEEIVFLIREKYKRGQEINKIAKELNLQYNHVYRIAKNMAWKHLLKKGKIIKC